MTVTSPILSKEISTVYLAGPMSGLPNFNYDKFNRLAQLIADNGFRVFNPAASFGGDQTKTRTEYALHDAELVARVDAVAVMSGWQGSPGTRFETALASMIGKPVIDAEVLALSGTVVSINVDEFGGPVLPSKSTTWAQDYHAHNSKLADFAAKAREKREARVMDTPYRPDPITTKQVADFFTAPADSARHGGDTMTLEKKVKDFEGIVDGGGYKGSMDDAFKLPLWLVPNALVRAASRALQHGAKKYASNNWRRGMLYSEVYSALQRHLTAWLEVEGNDKDSGLGHLDHAAACLSFLLEYTAEPALYGMFDNRFKRPAPAAGVVI